MVSSISFKSQSMNFTPKPPGVVNPNAIQEGQNDQQQNPNQPPAAVGLNQQTLKQAGATASNGFKSLIAYGVATGLLLLGLFKSSKLWNASQQVTHSGFMDNLIPVTSLKDLNSYVGNIAKESKKYLNPSNKKIKLSFPVEDYANALNKKNFLELTSSEVKNLRSNENRISDIAKGINGTLEAIRRTGNKAGINLTMLNTSNESADLLLNHIQKNSGFIDIKTPGIPQILSDVTQIESNPKYKGISFTNLSESTKSISNKVNSWLDYFL